MIIVVVNIKACEGVTKRRITSGLADPQHGGRLFMPTTHTQKYFTLVIVYTVSGKKVPLYFRL